MTRRERVESLVGAGLVLVLLVAAIGVTVVGDFNPLIPREKIHVVFQDVNFLDAGSVVRIEGLNVGLVEDLDLRDDGVIATLALDPGITMHPDYKILVRSLTLLGGRYVEVDRGNHRRAPIKSSPDRPLRGAIEPSATGIVDAIDEIQPRFDAAITDFQETMERLGEAEGTLGKLISDDELGRNLRNAMTRFEVASDQIRRMTTRAEGAGGMVARLGDPRLQSALEAARERIGAIADKVASGAGPIGALLVDEQLGDAMRGASEHIGAIADALDAGTGSLGREKLAKISADFRRTADALSSVAEKVGAGKGPLAAFASAETQASLGRAGENLARFADRPETSTIGRFSRDPKLLAELERSVRDYGESTGDSTDAIPVGSALQGQIKGLFDGGESSSGGLTGN